ncbi:MAG: inositol-phosphate phosphatase/L-galactose 1-phosphate phosphatase/histidinol-phosphatase [Gammaproteobacteria bacterium]|jgi:inositol-phosphate phosphatase/L-galactose 1-phosphate phosphatase/histidinol-phosphatase
MKDIDELVLFATELAELSRSIILSHPILGVNHKIKADGSPVTPVDRQVEQRLREHIDSRYPHHGVFGEEFPNRDIDAERVWVIDPIDGTRQYATGIPLYSTLIGLVENGQFVLGVMDFPATRDRWIGGHGYPTRWNNQPVTVGKCASLKNAMVARSEPDRCSQEENLVSTKLGSVGPFSICGAGSYGFAMLASGKLDIVIDTGLDPFDFAAPAAIIEAAGGSVCDWAGQPLTLESHGRTLFVGDSTLLQPTLEILQI